MREEKTTQACAETHLFPQPDMNYLHELAEGDTDFIADILQMFIAEAPESTRSALTHLQQKNFDALRVTVHKLKSSVQVVGGLHLTAIIQEIETAAKNIVAEETLLPKLTYLQKGIQQLVIHLEVELRHVTSKSAA